MGAAPFPPARGSRPLLSVRFSLAVAFMAGLVSVAPRAQGASPDVVTRYLRLVRESEAGRVPLAPELAAVPGARAAAVLRSELAGARSKALHLALLEGLGTHGRPELAAAVAEVLRPSNPDADLAKAVGAALLAMGDDGVAPLQELIVTFATGRSNHKDRSGTQNHLIAALGEMTSPKARTVAAALATKGHVNDRLRVLTTLAKADGEHGVRQARLAALSASSAPLVLQGLRQLAAHDDPDLVASVHTVAGRATGALETPLQAGIAVVAAEKLRPELYSVFFSAAAATDPTLARSLQRYAAKLRADLELGRFVLGRASSLKSAGDRTLAARLVGAVPGGEATSFLLELAQAKEPLIADTAIVELGARRDPEAIPGLRRLLRSPGADRRCGAMLALHMILRAEPAWRTEVRASVADPELQVLSIDLLADLEDAEFLASAQGLFGAPDWRVRAAAYDFCRRVRAASSIPLLVERLTRESDRMRQDVVDALVALTGHDLSNDRQWQGFWQENAATFVLPARGATSARKRTADAAASTRTYYSLPVVSKAAMFVVDRSGSMAAPIGTGGSTRLEEAKRQLVRVLGSTPAGYLVGVIVFDTAVTPLQDKLVELDERTRKDLTERVKALRIGGATNVHDGLAAAFADPNVDTIYLLTDGAPSAGPITDPGELRAEVARWNRTRRIRIHTIAVGTDSQLMKWLAADSGGQSVSVR